MKILGSRVAGYYYNSLLEELESKMWENAAKYLFLQYIVKKSLGLIVKW